MLVVPKFENEADEAQWWYDNRGLVSDEFELAAKEGRLTRGTLAKRAAAREASLSLDIEDVQKARLAAERKGVSLNEYVRILFHEAVERETAA